MHRHRWKVTEEWKGVWHGCGMAVAQCVQKRVQEGEVKERLPDNMVVRS